MKDFQIGGVISLLGKTAPFLVFRFLIYFGITLAFVLITGVGAGMGYGAGSMPVSERCAEKIFSLPMHPYLEADVQDRVIAAVETVLQTA